MHFNAHNSTWTPETIHEVGLQRTGYRRKRTFAERALGMKEAHGNEDVNLQRIDQLVGTLVVAMDSPERATMGDVIDAWPQIGGRFARALEPRAIHHAKPDTLVVACSHSATIMHLRQIGGIPELQQRLSDATGGTLRRIILVPAGQTPTRRKRKAANHSPSPITHPPVSSHA